MPTTYNKVVIDGTTLMDISDTTATASDVALGKYFYTTGGVKTEGTATGGGGTTPTLITKEITANGTYTASSDSADGYSSVTVNVPSSGITPTGSINITTNGTHDVTNYASAVVNVSGGGTPSATAHTIYFEFTDETDTTITAYYDSSFISDAITATTPTTYGSKTVTLAQLDGVTWYEYNSSETWETLFDEDVQWMHEDNGDYPYCWISTLGSTPIVDGSIWRVTYNNTEYRCTGKTVSVGGANYKVFGNPIWFGGADDGSNVPFVFIDYTTYSAWSGGLNVPNVDSSIYYFKIERLVTS